MKRVSIEPTTPLTTDQQTDEWARKLHVTDGDKYIRLWMRDGVERRQAVIVIKDGINLAEFSRKMRAVVSDGHTSIERIDEADRPFDPVPVVAQPNEREATRGGGALTPSIGEFIVCLFTPLERQGDRLADFAELFNSLWVPRFGARVAKLIYIVQALRSAAAVIRFAAVAAFADWIGRALGH
jgi:hypothetical protein